MLFAIAMFILMLIFVFLFVATIVIICVTSAQNKEGKTAPTAPVQMPVAKAPMTVTRRIIVPTYGNFTAD